jgi:chromatin segregation and condensation protein Rec8/ScpA/Scc1 (kleisin family)
MEEPEVFRLTKEFFADDEPARQRAMAKLAKRKNELPPPHETTRLVDRKERWTTKSWHRRMQELTLVSRRRIRRRKLHK